MTEVAIDARCVLDEFERGDLPANKLFDCAKCAIRGADTTALMDSNGVVHYSEGTCIAIENLPPQRLSLDG